MELKYTHREIGEYCGMSISWINKYCESSARITTQSIISMLSGITKTNGDVLRKMEGRDLIQHIIGCMDRDQRGEDPREIQLREIDQNIFDLRQLLSHSGQSKRGEDQLNDLEVSAALLRDELFRDDIAA